MNRPFPPTPPPSPPIPFPKKLELLDYPEFPKKRTKGNWLKYLTDVEKYVKIRILRDKFEARYLKGVDRMRASGRVSFASTILKKAENESYFG